MTSQLRPVLGLIAPQLRPRWVLVGVLGLLIGIFEAVGALLMVMLFASVQSDVGDASVPFVRGLLDLLPWEARDTRTTALCLVVAVFFAVRAVVVILHLRLQYHTAGRSGLDLSERLLRHYLRLPLVDHSSDNSARFVRNIMDSTQVVASQAFLPVIAIASETTLIVAILVVLLVGAPVATVLAGILIAATGVAALRFVQPRIGRHGRVAQEEYTHSLRTLAESFGGIRDVKVNGTGELFRQRFMQHRGRYIHAAYAPFALSAVPRIGVETTVVVALATVVAWVQVGSSADELLPMLALFGYAALRLLPAVNRLLNAGTNLRFGLAGVESIRADLEAFEGGDDDEPAATPLPFERAIELKAVTFTYPGAARPAVEGITLTIPSGSSLGVVGPTGSGKSTLVDLILGLVTPQAGTVRVDDVDVRSVLPAWHRGIGLVPQTIFLLDDTLRRNITFSPDATDVADDRLAEAVRLAQLEDVLASLPAGLDTVVGERGARLSGGQRQRVVIARALYRQPRVLVFDEGTSALDTATETSLFDALEALSGTHTVVMVAHRLSTVRSCDQVVVLQDGRIEAVGTPEELLHSSSLFRQLSAT